MPQAIEPLFPEAPPPFVAFFNFGVAGTVTETDNALNPNAVVPIFPDDTLPPVSASDGFGAWERLGFDLFRCTFTKFLFNEAGLQIAIVVTTLDLTVDRYGTLSGVGVSEFFMGAKPEGEPFFTGPVQVTGERQRVAD